MHQTSIAALHTARGPHPSEVTVAGFVEAVRILKRMIFVMVRDRTGLLQVTVERRSGDGHTESTGSVEHSALGLTVGSAVRVSGALVANPAVKVGGVELVASAIEVAGPAEPGLPIDEHSASDIQLDWRYLALRRPKNMLVFEVQTTVERAMREYWATHRFIELHSPKLMHSASESGADT